jgi:sugar/nucleoside kinase (ribokinase family)
VTDVTVFGSPFIDLAYGFPLGGTGDKLKAGVDLKMAPGGPAANVATGLARLGVKSAVSGKVGADWFGKYLRASFKIEGVETTDLTVETGKSSGVIFPIVDENGKQRSYELLNDPVQFELDPSGLGSDLVSGVDYLFADGVMILEEPSAEALVEATEIAEAEGVSVVFDPNLRLPPSVLETRVNLLDAILESTDYLLLNMEELEMFHEVMWPGAEIPAVKEGLMGYGLDTLIVKNGSCGHEVICEEGKSEYRTFEIETVDRQGAGDGFDAGFIAGLVNGMDVNRASVIGSAVGAITCSGMTAWEPLPDLDELRKFLKAEDENELAREL